jgi:hypothetical protein
MRSGKLWIEWVHGLAERDNPSPKVPNLSVKISVCEGQSIFARVDLT